MKLNKATILTMIDRAIELQCFNIDGRKGLLLEDLYIEFTEASIQLSYLKMNSKTHLLEMIDAAIVSSTKSVDLVLESLHIKISQRTDDGEWSYSEDTANIDWQPSVSKEDLTVYEHNYKCIDGEDADEE